MRLGPAIVFAASALSSPAFADDLTLVAKVTRDGQESTVTSYISSERVRMAQPGGQEVMTNLATGEITLIDGRRKEYYVMTRKDVEAMTAQIRERMRMAEAQMQKAQERLKNLPPAIRQKMESAMGGGVAAAVDVKKGDAHRTIAGYGCDTWVTTVGDVSKTEECLSTEVPVPAGAWEGFRDLAESMKGMMNAMGPMGKSMASLQEKTKVLRGIPLATSTTTHILGKTSSESTEVIEVRKGVVPANAWRIPAGYKKGTPPSAQAVAK